jgi:hypothetical protein
MSPRRRAVLAVALLAAASAARAMGGAQECMPEDLVPVDAWIAAHPWHEGPVNPNGLVASACRQSSADKRLSIVAAAYDLAFDNQKSLVVALVDHDAGVVRAAYKGTVREDALLQVTQGGLRLDTAPYDLAPGVRAFGVDVNPGVSAPPCAEAGGELTRVLFVRDGASLRPVLQRFVVSSWRLAKGKPVCEPSQAAGSVIETTTWTIAIAPRATHGYADLVVTESIEGRVPGEKVRGGHYELHYDGTAYRRDGAAPDVPLIAPEGPARH